MEAAINSWEFNPREILLSPRKVKGIFHKPMIDKDGEFITADAIRKSIPDYMHLPALHDFHKERPVGIATKIYELSGGKFFFEGVIKATADCDDIWQKISSGNYDQVSIFGKRTAYNSNCNLPQNMRSGPCITDGVRLDSISVCDENARNPQTSLEVQKAKVLFDAQTIIKAEDSSSSLMHSSTDYAGKKVRVSVKKCPACKREEPNTISKEDGDVTEEVEKGKFDSMGRNYKRPTTTEEPVPPKERNEGQKVRIRQARPGEKFEKANGDYEYSEDRPTTRDKSPHTSNISGEKKEKQPAPKGRYNPGTPRYAPETNPPKTEARSGNPPSERKPGEAAHNKPPAGHKPTGNVKFTSHTTKRGTEPMATVGAEYGHPGAKIGGNQLVPPDNKERPENTKRKNSVGTKLKSRSEKAANYPEGKAPISEMTREQRLAWGKKNSRHNKEPFKKGDEHGDDMTEEVEKSVAEDLEDESYDEDEDKDFKHAKSTDKDGKWSKKKDPDGTVKMSKAEEEGDVEKAEDEPVEKAEEDMEKAEEDDVEKGRTDRIPKSGIVSPDSRTDHESNKETSSTLGRGAKEYSGFKTKATRKQDKNNEISDIEHYHAMEGMRNLHKSDEEEPVEKAEDEPEEPKKQKKGKPSEVEEEEEDEEEEEEVEKGQYDREPKSYLHGKSTHQYNKDTLKEGGSAKHSQAMGKITRTLRANVKTHTATHAQNKDDAAAGLKNMTKAGEQMDENETDVEYVTKALVPIEEIDTIVKARTEEISKAYMGQLEEIKKAYDVKFVELSSKIEKMEQETIRKGANPVIIPELLRMSGEAATSNADAIARMQAGRT